MWLSRPYPARAACARARHSLIALLPLATPRQPSHAYDHADKRASCACDDGQRARATTSTICRPGQAESLCSVSSRAHGAPSARVASSSAIAGTGQQLCALHLSSSSQHHVDRRCSRAEKFSKIRFSVRSRGRRAHRAARPAAAPRTRAHLVEQISSLIHRRDRLRRMRQSLRRGCAFCRDVTRHGQGSFSTSSSSLPN